jgi:transcription-repair coupling factor (superfamily II helicase)
VTAPDTDLITLADAPEADAIPTAPLAELVTRYQTDAQVRALASALADQHRPTDGQPAHLRWKGLSGSLRALALAALHRLGRRLTVYVAPDREEAAYARADLLQLLPDCAILHFPASSKRPYEVETIDNANVLQRAEVLSHLTNADPARCVLVTYPEALAERVVNRQSLITNTLTVHRGETLGLEFVVEMLDEYGFEWVDFVSEPGQYAQRGGIVDIYSYSSDEPYRLEFDGDVVESIRQFDLESQLSNRSVEYLSILANIQQKLHNEARVNLLEFVTPEAVIWTYDLPTALDEMDQVLQRAQQAYADLQAKSGGMTRRTAPDTLYTDAKGFKALLAERRVVECGVRSHYRNVPSWERRTEPQPAFKKNFDRLGEALQRNATENYQTFISCENDRQSLRLREIFQQTGHNAPFGAVAASLQAGFIDHEARLSLYTDHQIFERYHRARIQNRRKEKLEALTLQELTTLQPGDFVTHVNHGVARFAGLQTIKQGDQEQEVIKLIFRGNDTLFVPVNALFKISRYSGRSGAEPKMHKLGGAEWTRTRERVRTRMKELAFDLVALYARRKLQPGFAYSADSYLMAELEANFDYDETPDQLKAIEDVKADMERANPMDRLVCGDVGFGKTEVAIRAAFKAACDGKQVVVLVPTTILALQHYKTFQKRLENLPVNIEYLNRFRSPAQQKETLQRLAAGQVDIIIGTHRLLSKDVIFKDLGLLIIDEEHRFGVGAKEKLRNLRVNVDTLALTATPIPRTLQFSLLGIRDLSIIATPPANRQPIETAVYTFDEPLIRDAVHHELQRGGQVFFIHNRIADLDKLGSLIKQLVPDARVATAHGQMDAEGFEDVMLRFMEGDTNVLVSTTIIESGIDIPNANTILINNAHMYGLSDLHQMRGRVGRSNRKAYCYLMAPPLAGLPSDSRKRLMAIEEFSDIGSGFQIAMRDLDIRGAGDILGKEQSGFVSDIGYDFYNRMLDEVIREIKEEHFADLKSHDAARQAERGPDPHSRAADVSVDVEAEARLPADYIPNVAERLQIYRRISETTQEADLQTLMRELQDRFGHLPEPALTLFDTVRLRELGALLQADKIAHKASRLIIQYTQTAKSQAFFESEAFQRLLAHVAAHPKRLRLKQTDDTTLQVHLYDVPTVKLGLFQLRQLLDVLAGQADS